MGALGLVAAAIVVGTAASAGPASALVTTGSIQGTVMGGGNPLVGICVVVDNGTGGPPQYAAATGAGGAYDLTNVPVGPSYVIRFENNNPSDCLESTPAPGSWLTQWYNGATSFGGATPVSVPNTGINATMEPAGTISGLVVNAQTGADVGGVCVNANLMNNGINSGPTPPINGVTAGNGTYTLDNIATGSYQVNFSSDCPAATGSWVQQWWESSPSQPTAINVTAPATVSGIDAALTPGGTIGGTVTSAASSGDLQNICVSVDPGPISPGQMPSPQIDTSTNSSGAYSLRGLPVGPSYVIRFDNKNDCGANGNFGSWLTQWYNHTAAGAASFATAMPVPVTTVTPVTGINAAMAGGGAISGIVQNGGNDLSNVCVSIDPGAPGGVVTETTRTNQSGPSQPNYLLNNLPGGTYKVRFDGYSCNQNPNSPATQWVTVWYNATAPGASTLAGGTSVTVTPGATTNLDTTDLVSGATSISGLVSSGNQTVAGICVTALPSTGSGVAGATQSTQFFNNNANYLLQGLAVPASGKYRVRFDSCAGAAGGWVTQWYNDAPALSGAAKVAVTGGTTSTGVNASMIAIAITSAGPDSAAPAGGTTVTIAGSGFTGATGVNFGTIKATNVTVVADNLITATAPAHAAGTVKISVVTPSGKSNGWSFTYT